MATVERFVRPADTVLPATATLSELARAFQRHGVRYLYIVDRGGRYLGTVACADIAGALLNGEEAAAASAVDFLGQRLPLLAPDMPLSDALARFRQHRGERLPVVRGGEAPVLLGVVDKSALLDVYACLHPAACKHGPIQYE
jgi:CIC family chloride channel protein